MVGRVKGKAAGGRGAAPARGYRRHDEFEPYLLNHVVSLINTEFQDVLRRYRLPFRQWRVLAFLHHRDSLPIGQLAAETATDQTTLSRVITQMEARGLVVRRQRPDDNRFVEIVLADAGRRTFETVLPLALELRDRYFAGFTPEERETLVALLKRIAATVEAGR